MSPKLQVRPVPAVSPNPPDLTSRVVGDTDPVDVSIEKLRLQGALRSAGVYVDVTNVISQGSITDSFTSAPQLVATVLDRAYKALNSGIFEQDVEVELDDVAYMLVEYEVSDIETLQLTFEHKIVALLRRHKSFLKVSRAQVTRAQFVEIMLREILPEFPDLIYICPELNTVQPVAGKKKTGRSLTARTLGRTDTAKYVKGAGFGLDSLDIRDWDGSIARLGPSQLHNAATVLDVCAQMKAGAKATLAMVEACIVEPPKPFDNPAPSKSGTGILQNTGGQSWANDVAESVQHALEDPGATSRGGMISLARKNPGWSAGQVAQAEQGSAVPGRYDQAEQGAQTVINAFTRAGGFAATGASGLGGAGAATAQYDFTRGQSGQTEDSYTCSQRLASEVNWRFFIAGRRSVYFVTDDDLIKADPKYVISPDSEGVAQPTFTIQKGGRTVVSHGRRIPKPSEGQVAIRAKLWASQVGDVIQIESYGSADGSWLLTQVDRDLFSKAGTIYFQAPQKPLPEPAASASTSVGVVPPGVPSIHSSNPIDRVYAASAALSARDLPYIFGGGHTSSWASAARAPGLDCSSAVSLVLYAAGLMAGFPAPITSGAFDQWGQPGKGSQMTVWYNAGHVFIAFYNRPAKRFDTVPGGSGGNGPHMRSTAPGSPGDTWEASGFSSRHWPGY